jgi:hypothetical protein
MSDYLHVEIIGAERLGARLRALPSNLQKRLANFFNAFSLRLQSQVRANIVANFRSVGPLYDAVQTEVTQAPDYVLISVFTRGIPYAQILEEGGQTAPHVIYPKVASAIAFEGSSGLEFAKRINHPGSHFIARPYASLALEQTRGELDGGIRQVVQSAVAAGAALTT